MNTKILGEIFKLNNKKLICLLNVILKLLKERNCPIRDDLEEDYILEKTIYSRDKDDFFTKYVWDKNYYEAEES